MTKGTDMPIRYGSDDVDFTWYPGYTCPETGTYVPEGNRKSTSPCSCYGCSYPYQDDNAYAEYLLDASAQMREAELARKELAAAGTPLLRGWDYRYYEGPDFLELSWWAAPVPSHGEGHRWVA